MKDWLLKEEKNKVGRPKLADEEYIKKAKILISFSFIICFILTFSFFAILKGLKPYDLAYKLTIEKLVGSVQNDNGFIVKNYYDNNKNYVIELKPSDTVYNYSGDYIITTYYLNQGKWYAKDELYFDNNTKNIKIILNSKKNLNQTWKINLKIKNGSKIDKSFAPSNWNFIDSDNQAMKCAYKVLTVKGYYSPVPYKKIKQLEKENSLLNISTNKDNPRKFLINVKDINYDVNVNYTDSSGKEVLLKANKNIYGKSSYEIPNLNRSSKVTFKLWLKDITEKEDLSKYRSMNCNINSDKNNNNFISCSYILKPEKNYKN